MKTFRDNKRRVWTLEVNVAAIKRVRGLCKVDLNSIVEVDSENRPTARLLEQLSSDPVLLVDVLYAICKPEADKQGVTDEEFGEAMAGDAIEQATEALLDEAWFNHRSSPTSRWSQGTSAQRHGASRGRCREYLRLRPGISA
jgi:hypothetical protein